jgi:pyridoxine kinase
MNTGPMSAQPRPAAIVISSHVVRGTVGNRASVFALETLGMPVWAVPTVTLAWHPGQGPSTRIVPDRAAFAALIADLCRAPWLGEVGCLMSGYLGEAGQAEEVARLVAALKSRNPEALYLCDPVIGDRGGLYVPGPLADAIRDRLLPIADIATPNRYELEWFAGRALGGLEDLATAAGALGPAETIVTSAPGEDETRIGNLAVRAGSAVLATHDRIDHPPHGTGDLFAASYLAERIVSSLPSALSRASAIVASAVARAGGRGADDLMLETDADCLKSPFAEVRIAELQTDGRR